MKKWRDWLNGSARAEPFTLPIDLTSQAFFEDPAPCYAWLRENHPIAPVKSGGFVLSRHSDVSAALSHPDLGNAPSRFSALNAKNKAKHVAADLVSNIPPFLDKPDHIPVRQTLSSAFYAAFETAQVWVPDLARSKVAAQRGRDIDLVADLARPFACEVMARFIGINASQEQIKTATDAFFRLFAPISDAAVFEQTNKALQEARDMISGCQNDDPVSLIAAMRRSGTEEQSIIDNALLMLADGVENIEAGCAVTFSTLATSEAMPSDPESLNKAVDEALRLSSPAQIIARVARADTQFHGTAVKAGTPVFLALGSANLDPDVYPNPLQFNPDRAKAPLLIFGKGRHSCIGAQLAQLQVRALIAALIEAGARLDGASAPMQWQRRFGHRWPVSLKVRVS